ncbi:hypothetical protein FG386_002380 [Cryptosporidium ryanae]|uniref:uncharacterized protein n=1 Tax=Cryptosporidium ryanae TaxID=515981 RepID=UPI00351A4BE1|nr:hypothetical protein FG386_002380 [Cryptosporidium ryanae]
MRNKQDRESSVIDKKGKEPGNEKTKGDIALRFPYSLKISISKDLSRSSFLEIRFSMSTLNLIGIANGTQCVLTYKDKSVCVVARPLDPGISFDDNLGLIGDLVCENLSICEYNTNEEIFLTPLKGFMKEKAITNKICKHAVLYFHKMSDLNSVNHGNIINTVNIPPNYIKDNKSIQQLIISRSRGHNVLQGNIIPVHISSVIYYFKVFEFDRGEEFTSDFNKLVKLGNQTKIELCMDESPIYTEKESLVEGGGNHLEEKLVGKIKGRKYGLDKIGGMMNLKKEINRCIIYPIKYSEIYLSFGVRPVKGVLFYGPPGTGKTLIARCIAEEIELVEIEKEKQVVDFIVVDGSTLCSLSDESEDDHFFKSINRIKDNVNNNKKKIFSILFIDEIDMICGNRDSFHGISNRNRRYLTSLLSLIDGFTENSNLILIATTNKPNEIDPALRRAGRFDHEIPVMVPNSEERLDILKILLNDIPNKLNSEELESIVHETQAFVGADLKMLINESVTTLLEDSNKGNENKLFLTYNNISNNLKKIKPSALRELSIEIPKTHWSDIGGYDDVKEQLKECIEWPLVHHELFKDLKVKPPNGVLLYGPPGCSKTLMAKAIATESKMNFISVKGPELFSKWVGESEKSIRDIFKKARQNSPCVIFFDEIDAIGINRENNLNSVDVSTRVLSQMLNEMDGISSNKQVIVIGATNRPDLLDSALLRPGRLDRIIYIGLPDSKARKRILNIYLKSKHFSGISGTRSISINDLVKTCSNYNNNINNEEAIFELQEDIKHMSISDNYDEMIDLLVKLTNGYSGAELALLCREIMMQIIRSIVKKKDNSDTSNWNGTLNKFTWDDIKYALDKVKPRIPDSLIQFYSDYRNKSNSVR